MQTRICFDDVAWERSKAIQDAWVHELFKEETLMAIGEFILKHRRGVPVKLCDPKAGAFNVSFRMKFEDGGSVIIRFPKPGATMFPDEKPDGIEAWTKVYESRLQTFLKVLREQEDVAIDRGRPNDEQRLSRPMQQSWESGDFWVTYAARKNFAFDAVFWTKLDGRFFGPGTTTEDDRWKERIDLLTKDERANMEKVVEKKLEEMRTRVLA
ncbi:hypothetical protein F1880_008446 [Penicillium rolfsii]|nr:hypothetical protein F1880_008446 [Penicillium rolfsii]